jgi:dTMP kinase
VSLARGRLIVFEAPEGAGKTTQLRRLGDWLTQRGVAHTTVREPGGTALGNEVRRVVLGPGWELTARAEALLFMASRAELIERVMRPALERGEIVLADRFFLSTYAYQVYGRGVPFDEVRAANTLATGGLVPDLTVLVSLRGAVRQARAAARGAADRIEGAGDDFHTRVEKAFALFQTAEWQRQHPECGPVAAVDGEGSEDAVFERILTLLAARWPAPFAAGALA